MVEQVKSKGRVYQGKVVSDKMSKTVVVKTSSTFKHARFNKTIRRTKKYKVHDEKQTARVGDLVEFCETSPVSKTKYMSLVRVVESKQQ